MSSVNFRQLKPDPIIRSTAPISLLFVPVGVCPVSCYMLLMQLVVGITVEARASHDSLTSRTLKVMQSDVVMQCGISRIQVSSGSGLTFYFLFIY